MLTTAENDLLCRVEGDAPMGRLMRRHWIPAALSEQLRDPAARRIKLSGLVGPVRGRRRRTCRARLHRMAATRRDGRNGASGRDDGPRRALVR